MDASPTIAKAFQCRTTSLAIGPGSALVEKFLVDLIGEEVFLVLVDRDGNQYTIVVDFEWTKVGLDWKAVATDHDQPDFQLPRSAMRAVVAGWPESWDAGDDAELEAHYAEDGLPHVRICGPAYDIAQARPDHF